MEGGLLGLFVGLFPTIAMLLASFLLLHVEVEDRIEACFQNFCAGLMICAVAAELFPIILDENSETRSVGVTAGLVLALAVIHGVEYVIKSYEEEDGMEAPPAITAAAAASAGAVCHDHSHAHSHGHGGAALDTDPARHMHEHSHEHYAPPAPPPTGEGSRVETPGDAAIGSGMVARSGSSDEEVGGRGSDRREHRSISGSGTMGSMQIHDRTPLSATSRDTSGATQVSINGSPNTMDKKRYLGLFDEEQVKLSAAAIAHKSHREHIVTHLQELMESITLMGMKTDKLLSNHALVESISASRSSRNSMSSSGEGEGEGGSAVTAALLGDGKSSSSRGGPLQQYWDNAATFVDTMITHRPVTPVIKGGKFETHHAEAEALAEDIDEEIHKVQYKLDHCRRLLQGSESGIHHHKPSWLTASRLRDMRSRIDELAQSVAHLLDHMKVAEMAPLDANALQEMYIHMDDMELLINKFHATVAEHSSKWRRSRPFPEIEDGESIPVGLVIPVCIDSFIDGLLIGITVAVSFKAGLILALANCLEMGFLGMALTSRVMKCTASSLTHRYASILVPPLIMLGASGLGGWLGELSHSIPVLFTAVVAFGMTAILYLVCNELLIEARELQGDEPQWWISSTVFLGIYVVLIMDSYIPA